MQWCEKQKVAVVNIILLETEICFVFSHNTTTTYRVAAFSYRYHLLILNNVKKKKTAVESNMEIALLYKGHKVMKKKNAKYKKLTWYINHS